MGGKCFHCVKDLSTGEYELEEECLRKKRTQRVRQADRKGSCNASMEKASKKKGREGGKNININKQIHE